MSSRPRPRRVRSTLGAVLVALVVASCGGSDGDDKQAQPAASAADAVKLVREASGPNRAARQGRIDGRVEIALEGVPAFAEPFSASISGPFRYRKGASLPDYELEMGVGDNGVAMTSLGGEWWVSLGSTGFKAPDAIRRRLVRLSARGDNGLTRTLEQFGVAPWRWETNQRIAGRTQIDGVEVVHVTTGFTTGRILKDANTLLRLLSSLGLTRATGLPDVIPRDARRIIARSVTLKKGASWIGVKDKVLRRSAFTMKFAVAERDRAKVGGISRGTVRGELNVSEVGRPQRMGKPATVGSFSDFQLGVDAVGDAQGR